MTCMLTANSARKDFTVTHDGFNDVKRHVQGEAKIMRSITRKYPRTIEFFAVQHASNLSSKIISAEEVM